MLPPPTLSFTIPSIHDNLNLQCRIYHPTCLVPTTISGITQWRKKAAIVAHPYAPLGGCFDDPIVDLVAGTILKEGFIVGTFNFRGAGSSGSTSWQSKPEQNDYISFIAFMIYYLHHLCPPEEPRYTLPPPQFSRSDLELHNLSPIRSEAVLSLDDSNAEYLPSNHGTEQGSLSKFSAESRLLLAGYSYGALITSYLPPIIHSIIMPFQTPLPGSAQAEIRLRAKSLASQQSKLIKSRIQTLLAQTPHSRLHFEDHILHVPRIRDAGNLRMGGEEDLRRASHDSFRPRKSFAIDHTPERVRKSVDRIRSMGKNQKYLQRSTGSEPSNSSPHKKEKHGSTSSDEVETPTDTTNKNDGIEAIPEVEEGLRVAYLLVSPLHGWINTLATMWSMASSRSKDALTSYEMKLTVDPTLAIFGDDDLFVSVKRLRSWVEKLKLGGSGDQFRHREVRGAGHFWHHHEATNILVEEIEEFVQSL